ncbi:MULTISPECIES: peptidoglycan D,D-transpeptidase FtsI family protein [Bacillaceae]|uniref:peptidoglycan D,D-transpeptidase FtsI family protein n=2 Tax=Bacillales TaxID=1385 RepID=UPI0004E22912|nr:MULTISPECIES: penicillin-binding protein 2 [Bacillaceae]MCF2646908.1 penicillin-binding protein 2 [Niallia circulans]CAI9388660.1 Penicillin-binding protein H [Bacillus sp. T2.9-1]
MGEKKKKKRNPIPLRVNLIFFMVFLLFSALILRLGFVQIVYGDDYKNEVEKKEDVVISTSVPRGEMYDRTGKSIVSNVGKNAITYTNWKKYTAEEMRDTAEELAKIIKMDSDKDLKKISERDKKDYWILINPDEAKTKISEEDQKQLASKYKDDKKEYQKAYDELLRNSISETDLNKLTDLDMETLAIYREFQSGYFYTPHIVKNEGVTDKEIAIISENLERLPGVDTLRDWDREYEFGSTLKTVLGNVSTSQRGVPAEEKDSYLAKGYSMNDRVGLSYLEKQYEDVLKGQKKKVKYIKDKTDDIVGSEILSNGSAGNDLVLTIDMDLQLEVEKIIEEELKKTKYGYAGTKYLDRAFVVLMDPHTGEILTMAGKQLGTDDDSGKQIVNDFALGNITTSYNVGSVVKGAMVITGYKEGVLSPGTTYINDSTMQIKGSNPFKSWKTMGNINDLIALKQSSNVFMAKTAIMIGKGKYAYMQPLNIDLDAYPKIRNSFSEFGLGVRTGIDLPNEMAGFKGAIDPNQPANLMFLSIGQYDTYTNMQLAQYISTIANGGYRIQPHLVKEIRETSSEEGQLGPIVQEIQPKVLNKLDLEPGWMEQIQKGFRMVMQPGGTGSVFAGASYSPAGKTGTAEAFYYDPLNKQEEPPQVMNVSLITYAPSDNPEVAMAVMVPWVYTTNNGPSPNLTIGKRVMDKYFELKKEKD